MAATKCWDEFNEKLPIYSELISAACVRKDQGNLKIKTMDSILPAVTTVIAKSLGIYSRRMSAYRTFVGLLLNTGGLTNLAINRFAKLYDSVTHQSLLPKINDLAQICEDEVKDWSRENVGFSIVMDNVDVQVKPRRESAENKNTMYHMVQAIGVADRVNTTEYAGPPAIPLDQVIPATLLPSLDDEDIVRDLLVDEVLKVWAELPAFKDVPAPSLRHQHSAQTSKKSDMVNLGVLMKNENKLDELKDCLEKYNELPEYKDDSVNHKLCVGDYLTFERGLSALATQSDGPTAEKRMDGLVMVMADFHVEMNFLKLSYNLTFKKDSERSVGSLYNAKTFLDSRNVTSDPTSRYYDCAALFDKLTRAYLVLAALKEFQLKDSDSVPSSPIVPSEARSAATRVVKSFVDLKVPPEGQDLRCEICSKTCSTVKNLRKHYAKEHNNTTTEPTGQNLVRDDIYNYSQTVLTCGLLRHAHSAAIRTGNGESIMTIYKYMFIMFKANGQYKYGCGLLETILQKKVLPVHLSQRLTWNRFCNQQNKPDTNIPLDQKLEHENRNFKKNLKAYRGTFSNRHIRRISLGNCMATRITDEVDKELDHHVTKTSKRTISHNDITKLVDKLKDQDLLQYHAGRAHSVSLLYTPSNVMNQISGTQLRLWMSERIRYAQLRNTYRQFIGSSSTTVEGCEEIDWGEELDEDWP